jgi:Fe-S-cluster containining protein
MNAVADRSMDPGSSGVVPFRFACHRCGHCCSGGSGHVWLEAHEIERMAAAVGATLEKFAQRFVREAVDPRDGSRRLALKETEAHGGPCALLVGRNTCSVYDGGRFIAARFRIWAA